VRLASSWAGRVEEDSKQEDNEGSGSATGPKKNEPIDVVTPLRLHRETRQVEKRIEDHARNLSPQDDSTREAEAAARLIKEGSGSASTTLPAPIAAVRLRDPEAPDTAESKEVIIRSRTTTGQVLWPATKEDVEILGGSKLRYPAPIEVEGSVIIRLVRLSDPVTSPVARVMRNRQFGIRGNEKWQLLAMGVVCSGIVWTLGVWQLRRMEYKKNLIEMRRTRLAMPRLTVATSPFPWTEEVENYVCRVVDVRGVFDQRREMRIGPRPGSNAEGDSLPGYNIVCPLRLEDGNSILINRGHVALDKLDHSERPEPAQWVRVRGVLEQGEIPNLTAQYARLKNRPADGLFVYMVAEDLAEGSGARNHQECAQALVTAIDVLYEDDFSAGTRRSLPFQMKHKEDYLIFWADEHTHFNYAMQWFGMGCLFFTMTIYKFIEVVRWRW